MKNHFIHTFGLCYLLPLTKTIKVAEALKTEIYNCSVASKKLRSPKWQMPFLHFSEKI